MKTALIWVTGTALLLTAVVVQADPIKDNIQNSYKAGWYPNFYKQKGPLTCQQTCKIWRKGVAEQEKAWGGKREKTHVCKSTVRKQTRIPVRDGHFLYGNQIDKNPICYVTDMSGNVRKNKYFYCLCIASTESPCPDPDLVVTIINRPQWDNTNKRSIITAVIKNIGGSGAGQSIARVIDPSTSQPSGAPQNSIANTPALAAGASTTVTFYLPYWVYNPDAKLEVTADYKGMVKECNEQNNTKVFNDQG